MGQKLLKNAVIVMTVVMMMVFAGCSNTDRPETGNKDTLADNITETAVEEEAPSDNSKEQAEPTAKASAATTGKEEELQEAITMEGGIKDVYAQYGLMAGTCLSDVMIAKTSYKDIITANFNQITLENFMKPDYILNYEKSVKTGELTVEFTEKTSKLLDWAKENGMKVRGHVMVWYSQTPDWIFYENFDKSKGLVDRDTMLARMESYIKQSFEQLDTLGYTDIFYAYDIVNEAIMENGSYRDCLWKQIIGDDYIWYAFFYADQYAPESIKLYYNDYNEQFKTNAIVKLANSLVDDKGRSLIDGIGCQGHLYTQDSIDQYIRTLQAFSKLGLDVQITELDVSLGTWQNILSPTEENLTKQGKYYYDLINRIIKGNEAGTTKVSGITFWGFTDLLSWRRDRSPMLFDGNLAPKYSYYGAIQDRSKAGY
jgi:endo-1,4-beta-xylanase